MKLRVVLVLLDSVSTLSPLCFALAILLTLIELLCDSDWSDAQIT